MSKQTLYINIAVCVDNDLWLPIANADKKIVPYIEEGIQEAFMEVIRQNNISVSFVELEWDEPC